MRVKKKKSIRVDSASVVITINKLLNSPQPYYPTMIKEKLKVKQ